MKPHVVAPDKFVARNGAVIEQCQLLTTHNLASLFAALHLGSRLGPALPGLARRCFEWICRRLQMAIATRRARLKAVRNAAYAWRQMLFFLSLAGEAGERAFVAWAGARTGAQREPFRTRFAPVVAGLETVAAGEAFGEGGIHAPSGGRRFLGWAVGGHWLLAEPASLSGSPRA